METLSVEQARSLMLHGQALLNSPARKADAAEIVRDLGYLQLDSINVLERAHHLIIGARWDGYRRQQLRNAFQQRRSLFEEWTHDACLIPIEHEPHWNVRRQRFQESIWANRWWQGRMGADPAKTQREILRRIESEGPLPTSAFRKKEQSRQAWWGWTPEKTALEFSWRVGLLAVHSRQGFEKVYDLSERVLPAVGSRPSREETIAWSCREALKRLGVATTSELAAFWFFFKSSELEPWCRENLERVLIGQEIYWVRPDFREVLSRQQSPPRRVRLLCAFDPLVRDRDRLLRFFDFHYRFEAFVPKAKRKYGYYVLPILKGDRLVGRLDAKLHRKSATLEVLGCWWEGRRQTGGLEKELQRLARRIGAETVAF